MKNTPQIQILIKKGIEFLKMKGVTKEEVFNLIDQIAADGQIDSAEAADLKRQIKAINVNSGLTITTLLASGAALIIEILELVGVI